MAGGLTLGNSPTSPVDVAVHCLFLCDTLGKDFGFNQHIIKPFVFLGEVGVVGEEAIHHLGRGLYVACLTHIAILHTKIVVPLLGADYLASHMPNAVDGDAVGEKPSVLGFGHIALGAV